MHWSQAGRLPQARAGPVPGALWQGYEMGLLAQMPAAPPTASCRVSAAGVRLLSLQSPLLGSGAGRTPQARGVPASGGTAEGVTCGRPGPVAAAAHAVDASCRFRLRELCWEATWACRPSLAVGAGTSPVVWAWLGATGGRCAGTGATAGGGTNGRLGLGRVGASSTGCDPAEQDQRQLRT